MMGWYCYTDPGCFEHFNPQVEAAISGFRDDEITRCQHGEVPTKYEQDLRDREVGTNLREQQKWLFRCWVDADRPDRNERVRPTERICRVISVADTINLRVQLAAALQALHVGWYRELALPSGASQRTTLHFGEIKEVVQRREVITRLPRRDSVLPSAPFLVRYVENPSQRKGVWPG